MQVQSVFSDLNTHIIYWVENKFQLLLLFRIIIITST